MTLAEFVKKYQEVADLWKNPPEDAWVDMLAVRTAGERTEQWLVAIAHHNGFSSVEEASEKGGIGADADVGPEADGMLAAYEGAIQKAVVRGVSPVAHCDEDAL